MTAANPYSPPQTTAPPPPAEQRRRPPGGGWFYYGWVMVPLASLAMAATLPGRSHGLGLITKRLLVDLSITPAGYAQMNFWATLAGAAFCLPCGWLIDRCGIRSVLAVVLLGLGAAVIWLSLIEDPRWLLVAVTLTRGFGQSMLSVVSITMVGKWFNRRLGPAMGVYSVVMSVLMAAATWLLGSEIIRLGWRAAWLHLGWGLLLLAPICWLAARNQPRDRRREFGGAAGGKACTPAEFAPQAEGGATLAQAMLTPCFWVFALSISFFGLVSAGLSLFNQYVLEERGFSESTFHQVLVIGLVTGMTANLAAGWLSRKVPLQRLLCFAMLVLAGALAAFPFVRTTVHVYAYAVANGIAGGFLTVLFFAVWGHAFGAARLGRIQSAAQMLTVFASALGPLLIAVSRLYTGSYLQVFAASSIVAALFAVVAWLTPVPNARGGAWTGSAEISPAPSVS